MERIQTVIIGGGVIGLSIARALSKIPSFHEIILLEQENSIGSITSSRNSEVIHAGIYYPKNSLKHRTCTKGRTTLYNYCQSRNIPFQKCGKLIVATSNNEQQEKQLLSLYNQGITNGVNDLELLKYNDVTSLEPNIECIDQENNDNNSFAAILSPSTGIIDSHALMLSLLCEAEQNGVILSLNSSVSGGFKTNDGIVLNINNHEIDVSCQNVINCAGLSAHSIANSILLSTQQEQQQQHVKPREQYFCKGNYFKLQGCKSPFNHLIYPLPESKDGLGIHATNDLSGYCRFGPDVQWLHPDTQPKDINYNISLDREKVFYEKIRMYYPTLQSGQLIPDYSGIRPKLNHPKAVDGRATHDFVIDGPKDHGIPGLINLLGIESPGLTANFALAEEVCQMLSAK